MLEPDQIEVRAVEFAALTLVQGLTSQQAQSQMGISISDLSRLRRSTAYKDIHRRLKRRYAAPINEMVKSVRDRLAHVADTAAERFQEVIETTERTSDIIAIGNSAFDRVGVTRKQESITHHQLQLTPETAQLLAAALREPAALELPRSDWTYATNPDRRFRDGHAPREAPRRITDTREDEHLLHGEGGVRIQGSGPGSSRDDGPVDSRIVDSQNGAGAAGPLEDESLDYCGFTPGNRE